MTETTTSDVPNVRAERRLSTVRCTLYGAGLGLLIGIGMSGYEYFVPWRYSRAFTLTTCLIVYPFVGAICSGLIGGNPIGQGWERPVDSFATEPLSAEERVKRGRRGRKFVWIGFGIGLVVALMASAVEFVWRGWPCLSQTLALNLFLGPAAGALVGQKLSLRPGDPKPSLRNFRLRTGTLMILTAYIALWLGLVLRTSGISNAARRYRNQAEIESRMESSYQAMLESQKEFSYGEQSDADITDFFSRLVDYHRTLASKYARAAQKPWLPVQPDPMMPLPP